MGSTSIEWTDMSWSPVVGCTRVSPGCDHCYAVTMTRRLEAMGVAKYKGLVNPGKGHFNGIVRLHAPDLDLPLRWRKPRRIFVNPMSDLFHEAVPDKAIDMVFVIMAATFQRTRHIFQILTKRPDRMLKYVATRDRLDRIYNMWRAVVDWGSEEVEAWPLPNVWLGVSVEDQAAADARIPPLLQTPAAVRFLSVEPLLGPVDLSVYDPGHCGCEVRARSVTRCSASTSPLDWVIVGGESGPGARPMDPSWARTIRDQCVASDIPFFFKQWGGRNKKKAGRLLEGRRWNQMPQCVGGMYA